MKVKTSSGFVYSYNPINNSIVDGEVVDMGNIHIKFKPLDAISELPNVSSFTIGVTEQCNFRCSYCCYSGHYREHRKHSPRKLSINDIKFIVDFMVKNSCQDVITVDFYGGESLLEFDWIKDKRIAVGTRLKYLSDILKEFSLILIIGNAILAKQS